jgi:Tfp pilus assembly protein PilO
MTATQKWLFGAVAAAVVVALGGWFLLISPKRAEVADLQAQTATQEQSNAQDQTQLEVLKEQNKDLPQKQAELAALRTKVPGAEDFPTYIRELQMLAAQSGVTLTSMAPAAAVTVGAPTGLAAGVLTPGTLAAKDMDLTLSGQFEGIQKFMNELENGDRYTLSTGLTIADDEESDNGGLTATVSARIYFTPTVDPDVITATTPGATSTPTQAP